jgi:acyl-coenzyme A thioesterase PaaI-like protein
VTAALATHAGAVVIPGELSRGPWDPGACHGGPVAALLARAIEGTVGGGVDWQVSRMTVELTRPVPLAPLRVATEVVRPGKKVSLVEATLLRDEDGVEVARARALRIRRADVDLPDDPLVRPEPPFGPPGQGVPDRPMWTDDGLVIHLDAVELRFAEGRFSTLGPVAVWIRLSVPVVAGEEPTGLQRAMAAADFANGVSHVVPKEQYRFINPDLTVHLAREPEGEWIGLRSASLFGTEGAGFSDTALYDLHGRFGRATQSLILERS